MQESTQSNRVICDVHPTYTTNICAIKHPFKNIYNDKLEG